MCRLSVALQGHPVRPITRGDARLLQAHCTDAKEAPENRQISTAAALPMDRQKEVCLGANASQEADRQ